MGECVLLSMILGISLQLTQDRQNRDERHGCMSQSSVGSDEGLHPNLVLSAIKLCKVN